MDIITQTDIKDMVLVARGKVRDIYDLGDSLLIVTTDRVSAFDVILPVGIPYKGYVLTKLSEFWFNYTKDIVPNHLITTNVDDMPEVCRKNADILTGRSMLVKKAKPFPVECVVRGYITGSGWKDYKSNGSICGIKLPAGMQESERFPEPIFTPSTKAELGDHDENISFERMVELIGKDAYTLKDYTIEIYKKASRYAERKGIIIADTKLEFGKIGDQIILIDEALTPDSSRFWKCDKYVVGKSQDSMDKQVIRDYLIGLNWDRNTPAPAIAGHIVKQASEKYLEIMDILLD